MGKSSSKKNQGQGDLFLNALSEALSHHQAIINASDLSFISTNTEGIITTFNRAAEDLTGYEAKEMKGIQTPLILHDEAELKQIANELGFESESDDGYLIRVFASAAQQEPGQREWTYVRKDGARIPVALSITALRDDQKVLIGYGFIARDISKRKAGEERANDAEAYIEALLNSMDDIAFEIDKHGIYTNVWTRKDSAKSSELKQGYLGKHLREVMSGDVLRLHKQTISKVLVSRQSEFIEYPVPGGDHWSSGKISYINPGKVLLVLHNDTKKKEAPSALESEEQFRKLAENIPGIIYLRRYGELTDMIYINERVRSVTGYNASEFLTHKIRLADIYHPDDRVNIIKELELCIQLDRNFHMRYRIVHKDGSERWVDEVAVGIKSDVNGPLIEGFIRDITLQKAAEEELKQIAGENYLLFNQTLNLNMIIAFDGSFKRFNPTWKQLLGWTDEDLQLGSLRDFIHPDDLVNTKVAEKSIQESGHLVGFENRLRCKDGSYKWMFWSATTDNTNQMLYASAIDISERKKSEEELLRSKQNLEALALNLQEQNRSLDEFAHLISHNLRSPIGNIKALISLLDNNSSVADYQQIFDKLKKVSENLGETMNELMETIKVKKEANLDRVEVRFKDIFDKVVQSLEGDLIHCEAHITFDFSQASSIQYSKAYLESIFQNLLSNAIKYRSPGRQPVIHAATFLSGNGVGLRVSDNGQGIDLERYGSKLFGLHKTFHEHKEAKGVGLFLVKTQVDAMGGSIRAESEPGKGTTFIIQF